MQLKKHEEYILFHFGKETCQELLQNSGIL